MPHKRAILIGLIHQVLMGDPSPLQATAEDQSLALSAVSFPLTLSL